MNIRRSLKKLKGLFFRMGNTFVKNVADGTSSSIFRTSPSLTVLGRTTLRSAGSRPKANGVTHGHLLGGLQFGEISSAVPSRHAVDSRILTEPS